MKAAVPARRRLRQDFGDSTEGWQLQVGNAPNGRLCRLGARVLRIIARGKLDKRKREGEVGRNHGTE